MIQHLHPYDILALGSVIRWHTLRTARHQTLADHKARVALLAVWLGHRLPVGRFGHQNELEVLRAALLHDVPETQFGDMPNPAKQVINAWLGELPGEPDAQDFDTQVGERFWAARGATDPMAQVGEVAGKLLKVADVLEAACFYWTEGLTLRRPGAGHLPTLIVREALGICAKELPELLTPAGEVLLAATVPVELVEEIEREVVPSPAFELAREIRPEADGEMSA